MMAGIVPFDPKDVVEARRQYADACLGIFPSLEHLCHHVGPDVL